MQSTHRPPLMAFALKSLTAAVASAVFLSSAATAAGLGKLTVLSALGQPLRAEIELTTSAGEDPSSMAVKLASPDAFRAANIEFNPALLSLRFSVEQRGGRPVIRLSSTQPLNEPFVDMLLELSWNNGRLVREYTFLLDPAELRATQPAQVAAAPEAPRSQAAQPPAAAAAAPVARAQEPARRPPPAPVERQAAAPAGDAAAPSSYRVRPGDTLGRIATRIKPADISLDMMLVALYRANPDAFIGNNMNRLKSGQILSVPDAEAIRGTGEGEARGVVVAHAADFNAYRNKLAGQVETAAPSRAPQAGQSAAGKVTAKVEERPTAANESQDQLRLSKAVPGAKSGPQGATASVEDTIAKQKELAQAEARVKELEKNVGELEDLMTVKSRPGSEAQSAAAGAATGAAAAGKTAEAARKPAAKPKKKPVKEEPSLADTLMDNITYIAAGAAVLLLAGLGLSQRRKRKPAPEKTVITEPKVVGVPTQAAHSLFAETGGQSVDTNNSVFNSSFAPSASQLDTNEVDPVAEADVYIAYGRDAQAEEILKEALRVHPERHPVRLKLLEIYAARKDLRAFETQASELYSLTRGQGDEWAQAAALGLSIDPLNPLYAGAPAVAPASAPSPQERTQQSLLSQQLEDAFRGGAPAAAALGAGAVAGAALAQDDADRTAVPADAEPRTDDNALDFDLGGLSFEPVSSGDAVAAPVAEQKTDLDATAVPEFEFTLDPIEPAAGAQPAATAAASTTAAADEPFDLSFDMNFDQPATAQPAPAEALADDEDFTLDLSPHAAQPLAVDHMVDMQGLAKEFDGLPPLPAMPQETVAAAKTDEMNDPLFDLDSMDFGAPSAPALGEVPAVRPAAAEAPAASEDPLFDLDAMDFGLPETPAGSVASPAPAAAEFTLDDDPFALPEVPAAAPAQAATPSPGVPLEPAFDLADFDLDLPQPASAAPVAEQQFAVEDRAAVADVTEVNTAAEMSPEHMEMETKLDLAIAYQEIGDKEGARELLDEVIKGGSSEQVSKASAMRELLA
ncbi:FimV/HubP family polar landmark protein [Massilia sp. AB1]|uniref:FimV/HubP family polar landmark protein n=1 Tax=Massilia sp. AB1 TaxID=2823371 RepID=UPI001B837546|nr:FimV/HubP family polar landmark protein [Massilia sp. AB1]MBQ5939158.1 LysM peptidoglycan-binding domain-containing protein [Massilia sp. AB1]